MLKLKIYEVLTQAYIHIAGFFATCFHNKNYLAISAALIACCVIPFTIVRALKALTKR